ncbi:queuosine precursor transporter [Segetibacter koreensis]|uniref:queuosine precursor transporter n=1 Tax=Segetibacter koreensis TaxID=398037 RepID=UPI00036B61DA|nr:queuosine precursor transporter [Segetibacter koreensis]
MIHNIVKDKSTKLFVGITAFFVANALIAECIGGKIFSLEKLLGLEPANITLFGEPNLSFNLSCGVLLWPLEFIITDIVNEYYGPKAVKKISYIAVALISYAFFIFYMAINFPPADFWIGSGSENHIPNMNDAFTSIFGQGMWIIVASIIAFLVSQLVDVTIFHKIKKITGEEKVWLRATGSTVVSQLVDSFIVVFIAFKIGKGWSWSTVLSISLLGYSYKFLIAVILTPVIYFVETRIEHYVGAETAKQMKLSAMKNE